MDNSDPNIIFDKNGVCDYCNNFKNVIYPTWSKDLKNYDKLKYISNKIKLRGSKFENFDCILGVSGGLDSSYAAYIAVDKMGLNPLLYHVDAGWNTEQAVSNIEKLVNGLGLELYTEVINWEEMKDLQVSFLKSQIPDQDAPQDTAFFSALYSFAKNNNIKYVITGANYSTECCREPEEWGAYPGIDKLLIQDIHDKFGVRQLKDFPIVDIFTYKILYQKIFRMEIINPLNYIEYNKKEAELILEQRFGWQKFQHKHHESRFTRFYEDYWLPRKFGFDKRRAHFSSLILTKQMFRDEAIERLTHSEMDENFLKQEFEYVAHKLSLSVNELHSIFKDKNKTFKDYKNKKLLINLGAKILTSFGLEKRLFR
jgi:N-acetyl sugar amidotransferase